MPDTYAKNMVYLSEAQYQELISNNLITVNGQTITYSDDDIYVTPQPRPILDVQINGTSIKSGETANISIANSENLGVIKINPNSGITANQNGVIFINKATDSLIKEGTNNYMPIVSSN